jgi:hypothetical protein
MVAGVLTLSCYGVAVNVMPWNFSPPHVRLYCGFTLINQLG